MTRACDPQETRRKILVAASKRIHADGFQAAGLSDILAETGATKGALYHHFPNKMALGYAVVDEIIMAYVTDWWVKPMEAADDPLEALAQLVQGKLLSQVPDMLHLGCPLNNLAQEMAGVDEGFRQRIEALYRMWRKGVSRAFRRGQQNGTVRVDIDAEQAAAFTVASLQGAFGQAKNAQSMEVFQDCLGGLSIFLTALRP